ncbi:MAG: aminoacyl-histidine dipeptidase [Bacteroidales bacterium]|nr:aminoacyl-histidine dipeptidase [Bacteroidales bacterium]
MSEIFNFEPIALWKHFSEVLNIPRPSDQEKQIREFLIRFAQERNLQYQTDHAGNLVIRKPATSGKENHTKVCLQSHLDMVCEKNADVVFNFQTDPIQTFVDGDWIKARGTTLGGDDGIGIAAQMAVLDSSDIAHGPLECLFTTAEETGLVGAFGLQPGFLQSTTLLNLDSEDWGELFIGCAGGIDLTAWFDFLKELVPEGNIAMKLGVKGLVGGHSGDDINKGLGNANKILSRFLWDFADDFEIRLHRFDGGNLRNAIPREAESIITLPESNKEALIKAFKQYQSEIKIELVKTEPALSLYFSDCQVPEWVIDEDCQCNFLNALYACPHGVLSMSQTISGLVETSTNLAAVKLVDDRISVSTSQRSSIESAKRNMSNMVESVFLLAGAYTEKTTGYPGWNPNPNSPVLKITEQAYEDLFDEKPLVKAIHAGLECGLFLEKYPNMDMISFGPTIKGVHSPDERLNISTTGKFWKLLSEVLKRIS